MIYAVSMGQTLKVSPPLTPGGGHGSISKKTKGVLWILSAIAVLILPSCKSLPPKTPPTGFYSALSPRPVASFRQEYSEADQAFFRFLRACCPNPSSDDIVFSSTPFELDTLLRHMARVIPGGFLFVEGEDVRIYRVMKFNGFSRLPFNWRTYSVYRKPLDQSA